MHSTKVCRAWELVALSLGIEPKVVGKPGTEQFTRARGGPEFEQRLDDLAAALDKGELAAQQHYAFGPASWKIYAGDFAAWARSRGWTLPESFNECRAVTPSKPGNMTQVEPEAALAGEVSGEAKPSTSRHSTKGKRAQLLDSEIEAAKGEATNPSDAHAVYAVLQRWAEQGKAPFIGFVEGEGIKYPTPAGGVGFFTFDALRKRMSRAAKAR